MTEFLGGGEPGPDPLLGGKCPDVMPDNLFDGTMPKTSEQKDIMPRLYKDGDFYGASEKLFDNPTYGAAAASLIAGEEMRAPAFIEDYRDVDETIRFSNVSPRHGINKELLNRRGVDEPLGPDRCRPLTGEDKDQIIGEAIRAFNESVLPFNVVIVPAVDFGDERDRKILEVVKTSVTQAKLQKYVERFGYGEHTLHGTLGKALDVLNVMANPSARARAIDRIPVEFDKCIRLEELLNKMRDFGVKDQGVETFMGMVKSRIDHQLRHGQPVADSIGEIAVEGSFDFTLEGEAFAKQEFAESPLIKLGKSITGKYTICDFFRQFPDEA